MSNSLQGPIEGICFQRNTGLPPLKPTERAYVTNCLIKPRMNGDNPEFLFHIDVDNDRIDPKLDGYAIIPIEEYERLRRNS